jgi:hypothetical protein
LRNKQLEIIWLEAKQRYAATLGDHGTSLQLSLPESVSIKLVKFSKNSILSDSGFLRLELTIPQSELLNEIFQKLSEPAHSGSFGLIAGQAKGSYMLPGKFSPSILWSNWRDENYRPVHHILVTDIHELNSSFELDGFIDQAVLLAYTYTAHMCKRAEDLIPKFKTPKDLTLDAYLNWSTKFLKFTLQNSTSSRTYLMDNGETFTSPESI